MVLRQAVRRYSSDKARKLKISIATFSRAVYLYDPYRKGCCGMWSLARIFIMIGIAILLAAIGFLATWDMVPPTVKVEKVILHEQHFNKKF